jgi:hypothetical protein
VIAFDEARHEYRLHGRVVPSVTQILRDAGVIDATWFTQDAAERGTRVHRAIHCSDMGIDCGAITDEVLPYLCAWREFVEVAGVKIIASEKRVWSSRLRYAGTLDKYAKGGNKALIIDIKTGPVMPWCALQTAAYMYATLEMHQRCDWRMGVHLGSDGKYAVHSYGNFRADFAQFTTALLVWRQQHNG